MLLGLLAVMGVANADTGKPGCQANYKQEGSFFGGRSFSTFDVLPGVSRDVAFKRVYTELMKSGFKVTSSDKGMGVLTAEYVATHNGGSVSLPVNVVIEPEGKSVKVNISKTTPGGYATSEDFQIKQMCAIIDTANGK
ncbi:hypothetical protein GCM10027432_08830 [Lysobacter fragariae]